MAKPVLRSTPSLHVEELAEDTSSERILRNKECFPFLPSWSVHTNCLQQPLTHWGYLQGGRLRSYPLVGCLPLCRSTQRHVWGWSTGAWPMLPSIAEQGNTSLSKRGNGLHFRVWRCRHVSFPIDQMDTTEGSEVWVILKDLHPGGLPGHRLGDAPVVYHWKTGAQDHNWLPRSYTAHIQSWHGVNEPAWDLQKNISGCVWERAGHENKEHQPTKTVFTPSLPPANSGGARDPGWKEEQRGELNQKWPFFLTDDH